MSKLGDFFTGLGYKVSKDNVHRGMQRVRVEVPAPSDALYEHLLVKLKEGGFNVNELESTVNYVSSQIFIWLNPEPLPEIDIIKESIEATPEPEPEPEPIPEPEPEPIPEPIPEPDLIAESLIKTEPDLIAESLVKPKDEEVIPEEVKEIAEEL